MRKVIGAIMFCIGFLFLMAAGSAVDMITGSASDVAFGCIMGVIFCACSLVVTNWEYI